MRRRGCRRQGLWIKCLGIACFASAAFPLHVQRPSNGRHQHNGRCAQLPRAACTTPLMHVPGGWKQKWLRIYVNTVRAVLASGCSSLVLCGNASAAAGPPLEAAAARKSAMALALGCVFRVLLPPPSRSSKPCTPGAQKM